ncbi:YpjP family protein [Lysinibacillus piscis]|uniref:Cell division protein FtsK n=1 Tax=Lysinibacillus piscis TaxID=2518931 RepID=A0ABQ5NLG2_9BACI|nr:YpjP family protein [Lysinibacillus sp. KH24]GLC88926.1 cell division protein FtsK [Lysinibacillus sp. KH24]
MKKWIQKSIVITVALLTFGLITPTHEIWEVFDGHSANRTAINPTPEDNTTVVAQVEAPPADTIDHTSLLIDAAKEQSYLKFGTKIGPKIGEEFDQIIFPKMEEAIAMTVARLDEGTAANLTITERPSGNYGEKIFNISNTETGNDVIRFHVRTEKRPLDGYFYNFHYHSAEDDFTAHNHLGDIYWEKNTPPKWLS